MNLKAETKYRDNSPIKGKSYWLILFFLIGNLSTALSQISPTDTLKLNKQQFEELFLKQNLLLMAEKFTISQADALVIQAKLWPNPSLTIDQVNLWTTQKQRANLDQALPPIFGHAIPNTQFAVQLEHLIQTAGKRKKSIAIEEHSVQLAKQQFEELLRNLKLELRTSIDRLQYLQRYKQVFRQQQLSIKKLLKSYQKQVEQGNVSKAEFIRLQALQLEISKEISELAKETSEVESNLKILLHVSNPSLYVLEEDFDSKIEGLKKIGLAKLYEQALSSRPDIKISELENKRNHSRFQYEKAQRIPNLGIISSYDRGGGIWPSYLSFGLAIELPFFDRNQGNIKHAKIGMNQTKILLDENHFRVQTEVFQHHQDLLTAIDFYESIDPQYEGELDELLGHYMRNFTSQNLSLLEYLDFQKAYLENKKIILESQYRIQFQFEELQYTIGTEIN